MVADNGWVDSTAAAVQVSTSALPSLRVVDAGAGIGAGRTRAMSVWRWRTGHRSCSSMPTTRSRRATSKLWRKRCGSSWFVAARLDCEALNTGWVRQSLQSGPVDGLGAPYGRLPFAAGCGLGIRSGPLHRRRRLRHRIATFRGRRPLLAPPAGRGRVDVRAGRSRPVPLPNTFPGELPPGPWLRPQRPDPVPTMARPRGRRLSVLKFRAPAELV